MNSPKNGTNLNNLSGLFVQDLSVPSLLFLINPNYFEVFVVAGD